MERIVSKLKALKQSNVKFMEMSTRRYATFFQRRIGGNGAGHLGAEHPPIQ
jgi:hypothetical protein